MSEDFIDKSFADLDEYYPGSKRKRKPIVAKSPKAEESYTWDAKPYKKTLPNGRDLEMFTIGALATALGRPVITIRAWIKEGYLPASPYRLPTTKNVKGEDHAGRRLYSRAMVEKLIELFTSAGLLDVKRIEWSLHQGLPQKIADAWNQIRAEETK